MECLLTMPQSCGGGWLTHAEMKAPFIGWRKAYCCFFINAWLFWKRHLGVQRGRTPLFFAVWLGKTLGTAKQFSSFFNKEGLFISRGTLLHDKERVLNDRGRLLEETYSCLCFFISKIPSTSCSTKGPSLHSRSTLGSRHSSPCQTFLGISTPYLPSS